MRNSQHSAWYKKSPTHGASPGGDAMHYTRDLEEPMNHSKSCVPLYGEEVAC